MNVFEVIRKRSSIRSFINKPVEEEKIRLVLEAGRLAPSAKNLQEWRFIVVKKWEVRQKLAYAANRQLFIGEAPIVIVACAVTNEYVMSCGQLCYPIDVAIALDHISLAAVELGLGTCWIGAFNESKVKEILKIPKEVRVVQLMPIGYPAYELVKEKDRLPFEKIVKIEKW
ncbi:MAG: nitroreductase [miscellaneous Crenarchaeota group-6 archaeon AD8-1]|nr:MAG: nitroreductase [miscellaneous Crenarchaeota group-6 archaeon AD8-1]